METEIEKRKFVIFNIGVVIANLTQLLTEAIVQSYSKKYLFET